MPSNDWERCDCRSQGCERAATRTLEIPAFTPGLDPFVFDYCGEHADEILSDGMVFRDAREITAPALPGTQKP